MKSRKVKYFEISNPRTSEDVISLLTFYHKKKYVLVSAPEKGDICNTEISMKCNKRPMKSNKKLYEV